MKTLPNFDAMPAEDLWSASATYRGLNRAGCAALLPDKPRGYTLIGRSVANLCANLAAARGCRLRGDIPSARVYEGIADLIYYDDIPEALRW